MDPDADCFRQPVYERTRLGSEVGQALPPRLRNATSPSGLGSTSSRLFRSPAASGLLRSPPTRLSTSGIQIPGSGRSASPP
jgi:hypothetical protein